MTSGKFASYPIDQITVNREERQRKELVGIPELAESIKRTGLIHPPTITKEGELKTGERRWEACKFLGWTHIPVQFLEDMNEEDLQLLELEENVRRVDLTWQDQCIAVEKYHGLRAKQDDKWSTSKTAAALGFSYRDTLARRDVAKEIELGNAKVMDAPRYSIAKGIINREGERKKTSSLAAVEAVETGKVAVIKSAPILNTDFNEWAPAYTGTKFNFIHCDFPYGIKANKHHQGAAASFGGYEDDEDVYWQLLDTLAAAMENVVAPNAHLMFWFSMEFYQPTVDKLTAMGWSVNKFPLIWYKTDNMGILPDPSRGPRRIYETALMASRDDRKIIRAISNVVAGPTTKTIHMSEKPIQVLSKFFEMFVDEYTVMLDPTAGSANAVKVAEKMKANTVLGLEQDVEFFNRAKEAYYGNDD